VVDIKALDREGARKELGSLILNEYVHEERRLCVAELYAIEEVYTKDVASFYRAYDALAAEAASRTEEEVERREYERLKQRFDR